MVSSSGGAGESRRFTRPGLLCFDFPAWAVMLGSGRRVGQVIKELVVVMLSMIFTVQSIVFKKDTTDLAITAK